MTYKQLARQRLGRRSFLRVGTIPLLGLGLPRLLAVESSGNAASPARNVILVWLDGGPSTIDMWDLKPDAKASIRGEFRPVETAARGVRICEHLPLMARQMDHCTLIRSVSHTVAEHAQGAEHVLTGNPISPALEYPSIGSIVSSQATDAVARSVPTYMDLSPASRGGAGYLGPSHDPFLVERFWQARRPAETGKRSLGLPDGFAVDDLSRRRKLLTKLERGFRRFEQSARAEEMSQFQQHALDILTADRTRKALDLTSEPDQVSRRYGRTPLGRSALAARRLVQAGVRCVTIGISGWDTHVQNFVRLRGDLLPQLDAPLSALIEDLHDRGVLDQTIVYCVGEFNRTPQVNDQGGRDHWARAMSVLIAGGGFTPGMVHGATDRDGAEPIDQACSPADVNATILNQLGIGPETKLQTRSGRPMPLFRDGTVIEGITNSLS